MLGIQFKTMRNSTMLATPIKMVTTNGNRIKAAAAVIAAAMVSAMPVVKIVGAITVIGLPEA